MNARERKLIGHGAIVSLIALCAGFGLVMSLVGGFEIFPGMILKFEIFGTTDAWARAHAGGLMNGILMFSIALVAHAMKIPEALGAKLHWMLVGTGYANTAFYWGALLSPSRAITFGDNRHGESNIWGVLGFAPALVFALVLMVAIVLLAREAFVTAKEA